MTEMVYGSVPAARGEPIVSKWWRTIDKWTLSSILILFSIGLLLGFASSPPLAEKNGFGPFHYVERQMFFGSLAFLAMLLTSLMSVSLVRRLAVIGFVAALFATALLPIFGTDFGKGSIRWYSLGFASLQPSEFLKPGFIVVCAWLMAASEEINGPPGRLWSFLLAVSVVVILV
ncbi:MAG: FtsW/RodA/SpoVE family cell cycle protein, partial [Paracoccaceae bacterium]